MLTRSFARACMKRSAAPSSSFTPSFSSSSIRCSPSPLFSTTQHNNRTFSTTAGSSNGLFTNNMNHNNNNSNTLTTCARSNMLVTYVTISRLSLVCLCLSGIFCMFDHEMVLFTHMYIHIYMILSIDSDWLLMVVQ